MGFPLFGSLRFGEIAKRGFARMLLSVHRKRMSPAFFQETDRRLHINRPKELKLLISSAKIDNVKTPQMKIMDQPDSPATQTLPKQPRNPLHGKTLEAVLTELADYFGWEGLGQRIPVRCFTHDPSISSSLKFLRKTPWAREKTESLYLFMLREQRREKGP
jgi:hypothetical protein